MQENNDNNSRPHNIQMSKLHDHQPDNSTSKSSNDASDATTAGSKNDKMYKMQYEKRNNIQQNCLTETQGETTGMILMLLKQQN